MKIMRATFGLSWLCALAFVAGGCGGSSSSGGSSVQSLCKQVCQKEISLCLADAGTDVTSAAQAICDSTCSPGAIADAGVTSCTNNSQIQTAVNLCAAKTTCADYKACTGTIPDCTTGGSGGATGTGSGGATGTGSGGATGSGSGGATGTGTGGATGTGSGGSKGTGTGGTSGTGTGGATGTTAATCADLTACCNRITTPAFRPACNAQVTSIQGMVTGGTLTQAQADAACAQGLALVKATYCP